MELFHAQTVVVERGTFRQREIVKMRAANAMELKQMTDEFEAKIYEKSGATVFDRSYNRQNQTVKDMIRNLALEAVPESWEIDVRVEEFSHFILLIYLPQRAQVASVEEVERIIKPVVKYAHPYLTDIAVFNYKRQSYLYFDADVIEHIRMSRELPQPLVQKIWGQGQSFQSFNAIPIKFETYNGHMIIPVKVIGRDGVMEEKMLFDTGASATVIPLEIAYTTQNEDLNNAERQTFETANGRIESPMTQRKIIVGGVEKDLRVAVFPKEGQTGLLGVDFLKNMRYVVDSESSTIYVWEKG